MENLKKIEFGEIAELRKEKFNPLTSNEKKSCLELEHFEQVTGKINGFVSSAEQKSIKNVFYKGDVLFGKLRPYLRKYWLAEFDGVCSSEVWVLKPKSKDISNEYLFNLIQTNDFIQAANVSSGSKMPRADWDYIINFPFSIINSINEQTAIAHVLSTADAAIQTTEKLIAQKEQRKKWLMQQLLTGKKRLKGFSGEWEDIELGELLDYEQPTKYLVKDTLYDDSYSTPVLTAGKTFILGYTNENDGICKDLPVIIFDDFTTSSKFVDFPFKAKSSAMKLLRPKLNVNLKFVYEAMQLINYTVGGHERHWISKFVYLTIPCPPIEEQTAIAQVLQAADKEINLLKTKVTKLREQKKGLMQQLLTGKVRLKH